MANLGILPNTAAKMLGNDPAVYLRRYAHLYPDDLKNAAAALGSARDAELNKTAEGQAAEEPAG